MCDKRTTVFVIEFVMIVLDMILLSLLVLGEIYDDMLHFVSSLDGRIICYSKRICRSACSDPGVRIGRYRKSNGMAGRSKFGLNFLIEKRHDIM